jgi:hypothetical protein
MLKKYPYLVQMASIKKDDWRLQDLINKGLAGKELLKAEGKLWNKIEKIAKEAKTPPSNNTEYPGSSFLAMVGNGLYMN